MGFCIAWRAVPADQEAALLAAMRLREAGPAEDGVMDEAAIKAVRLPSGWFLVLLDGRDDEALAHAEVGTLGRRVREMLAVDSYDTVMTSLACGWRDGVERWTLFHNGAGVGPEHLEVEGEPPAGWQQLRDEAAQEGNFYELPVDLAASVCGFRHDEDEGLRRLVSHPLVRGVGALLAAVPVLGHFVCLGVLFARGRKPA